MSKYEARERLLALEGEGSEPRGRALCFAGLVGVPDDALLHRAASLGDALAQGWLGLWGIRESSRGFAEASAAQGHPMGLFAVAMRRGVREGRTDAESLKLLLAAADRGWAAAMFEYGWLCGADEERFRWWGRAADRGLKSACRRMQEYAPGQLARWRADPAAQARTIWVLGTALRGRVEGDCAQAAAAAFVVKLVDHWTANAREALWSWMLAARRVGVVRDVARMIGRMAWQERIAWAE